VVRLAGWCHVLVDRLQEGLIRQLAALLHGVDPTVVSPAAIWRRPPSERGQLQIPSKRLPATRV
jgi:hypothetical protein